MRLDGKVALITGAGSGIGLETTLLFAAEGAAVLAVDVNEEAAAATVARATEAGGTASVFRADVSKAADNEAMVAAAEERYGKLDVMFNNAGISHADDDNAVTTTEEVWDLTFDINVKGVFFGCKYGIPALEAGRWRFDHQHGVVRGDPRRRHPAARLHGVEGGGAGHDPGAGGGARP
jgi:NAD(P)-dependent dehydrogenase (short-subunit alcohol dehydrogenase family)